jgi:hypothetical protein
MPIDYQHLLAVIDPSDQDALIDHLAFELPYLWADDYKATSPHAANIHRITSDGFEYLFDFSSELVSRREVSSNSAVEDRIIAVHGRSRSTQTQRKDSLMRKHPLGPVDFIRSDNSGVQTRGKYDKGHFIGHAFGGQLHINLFTQSTSVNRGWSEQGKLYRKMERYCQQNPGTYCFSRPLYIGYSAHPYVIEFGVLKDNGELWVNQFPNCEGSDELEKIEALFRAKIAGKDDNELRSLL